MQTAPVPWGGIVFIMSAAPGQIVRGPAGVFPGVYLHFRAGVLRVRYGR